MKAFILAAGFGTRLKPFTLQKPKALVPVNGVPLILYILAFLKHHRIKEVVINLHHKGEHIPKLLGNGHKLGMKINYSRETKILGTGGGIKKALRYFKDDMLIINGDVIADFDLSAMIKQHKQNKPVSTLALYDHPQKKKFGLLAYKKDQLLSILNEPPAPNNTANAMFGSYHILAKNKTASLFKTFKKDQKFCIMRDIYIPLLAEKNKFGAFQLKGFWCVNDSLVDVKQNSKKIAHSQLSYQKELLKIGQRLGLRPN